MGTRVARLLHTRLLLHGLLRLGMYACSRKRNGHMPHSSERAKMCTTQVPTVRSAGVKVPPYR